jgi:hypothetical protein
MPIGFSTAVTDHVFHICFTRITIGCIDKSLTLHSTNKETQYILPQLVAVDDPVHNHMLSRIAVTQILR